LTARCPAIFCRHPGTADRRRDRSGVIGDAVYLLPPRYV